MKSPANSLIWALNRKYLKDNYTVGVLSLDGKTRFCDTLEDKVRDLDHNGDLNGVGEGKVDGKTAIPYGRYKVVSYYSPKFDRIVPLLQSVKHFTAIEIHSGNTPEHTAGCILVGDNFRPGRLVNGGYYERKLVEYLLSNEKAGITTYIEIK